MKSLIEIGKNLTPLPTKTEKTSILRMRLNLINKNLPARVWLPLNSDIPHHVVRITEEKTAVLNSKDKTPYIIYVEVVEVRCFFIKKKKKKGISSNKLTLPIFIGQRHIYITSNAKIDANSSAYKK